MRESKSGHPLAPALSREKSSRRRLFLSRVERRISPMWAVSARGTRPGLRCPGYRARRARSSHPSGSRLRDDLGRSVPGPLAHPRPRKPSVPDRVQFTAAVHHRDDGQTDSWLAAVKTAPSRFWLTFEAYPSAMPAPPSAVSYLVFSFKALLYLCLECGTEAAAQSGSVARSQSRFRARRPVLSCSPRYSQRPW